MIAKLTTQVLAMTLSACALDHMLASERDGGVRDSGVVDASINDAPLVDVDAGPLDPCAMGSVDARFGGGGSGASFVRVRNATLTEGQALHRLPNGSVLVAGLSTDIVGGQKEFVAKLDAEGNLDTTFGDEGIASMESGFSIKRVYAVNVQSTGRIIVLSSSCDESPTPPCPMQLLGLTPEGEPDHTFARVTEIGYIEHRFDTNTTRATDMAIASDDSILVVGPSAPARYIRFRPQGFGNEPEISNLLGDVELPAFTDERVFGGRLSIGVDSADRVYIAGYGVPNCGSPNCDAMPMLQRLSLDGVVDASYGAGREASMPDGTAAFAVISEPFANFSGNVSLRVTADGYAQYGFTTVTRNFDSFQIEQAFVHAQAFTTTGHVDTAQNNTGSLMAGESTLMQIGVDDTMNSLDDVGPQALMSATTPRGNLLIPTLIPFGSSAGPAQTDLQLRWFVRGGAEASGSPRRPAYDPANVVSTWTNLTAAQLGNDGTTDVLGRLDNDTVVLRLCTP